MPIPQKNHHARNTNKIGKEPSMGTYEHHDEKKKYIAFKRFKKERCVCDSEK